MLRDKILLLIVLAAFSDTAGAGQLDELYTAPALVSVQGEENRKFGFRDCLDRVLLRVSANQRLKLQPQMKTLQSRAGSFVQSFSYRDRLAGKPIHDELGTYDRPRDLTCRYGPTVLNRRLLGLRQSSLE